MLDWSRVACGTGGDGPGGQECCHETLRFAGMDRRQTPASIGRARSPVANLLKNLTFSRISRVPRAVPPFRWRITNTSRFRDNASKILRNTLLYLIPYRCRTPKDVHHWSPGKLERPVATWNGNDKASRLPFCTRYGTGVCAATAAGSPNLVPNASLVVDVGQCAGGRCSLTSSGINGASTSRPGTQRRIHPDGVAMAAQLARPHVLDPHGAVDPCSICEARALSVCNAVPDSDVARLSSIAVVTEVSGRARLHRRGRAGHLLLQHHRRHRQAVQAAARRAAADHRLRRPRPVSWPRGLRYLRLQRRGDRACALLPVPAGRAACPPG